MQNILIHAHPTFPCPQIIPPPEWQPRKKGYNLDDLDLTIPAPICQVVTGKQGLYQQINIQKKPMTVKEFCELANSERWVRERERLFVHLDSGFIPHSPLKLLLSASIIPQSLPP